MYYTTHQRDLQRRFDQRKLLRVITKGHSAAGIIEDRDGSDRAELAASEKALFG